MKLLLATHNRNKVRELSALIADDPALCGKLEVISFSDIGHTADIEENGATFADNALIKARAGAALGYLTVADDSGLVVDALGGAPGVFSARYAGEHANDEENNRKLMREMENVPDDERTASFVSVIACVWPDGSAATVSGECRGHILRAPRGQGGFGYDPYFLSDDLGITLAEATEEQKNAVSHRGRAMRKFCRAIAPML